MAETSHARFPFGLPGVPLGSLLRLILGPKPPQDLLDIFDRFWDPTERHYKTRFGVMLRIEAESKSDPFWSRFQKTVPDQFRDRFRSRLDVALALIRVRGANRGAPTCAFVIVHIYTVF